MIVIQDTESFSEQQSSCVATIGKFDGVHLGHQLILDQLKEKSEELSLPSLVILIEPHPEEFFAVSADNCPARLTELPEKLELLESFGIDYVYQFRFDLAASQLSAQDYIKQILVDGLGVACFIVGNDFRFGHQRQGNFQMLQAAGQTYGFDVLETASYELKGHRVSSTYIRELLFKGDFKLVEILLGREYSITGVVVKGLQLGSDLGFPTCNVKLERQRLPLHGVYACEVNIAGKLYPAAVNIGYRPTVTDNGEALLEAHILNFKADLYGQSIQVFFRHKLRDEEKFDDLETLKQQIAADVEAVQQFFKNEYPESINK